MTYKLVTAIDSTKKIIFAEGYISVIIPTINEKYTVCVSCQVGCPIGCKFCHTGKLQRNLSANEIVDQVRIATDIMKKKPQSIVYMGMGEPMTNFLQVEKSIHQIHKEFSLSYHNITVSTSGVNVDALLNKPYNAALSLHTLDQKKRKELMPATMPISRLLPFVTAYCKEKKHGLMIEYALIAGENDADEDIERILAIDWPKNINFNLIEYNNKGQFMKSDRLLHFKEKIREKGYKCFIRHSRGADIDAACGMLDIPA